YVDGLLARVLICDGKNYATYRHAGFLHGVSLVRKSIVIRSLFHHFEGALLIVLDYVPTLGIHILTLKVVVSLRLFFLFGLPVKKKCNRTKYSSLLLCYPTTS